MRALEFIEDDNFKKMQKRFCESFFHAMEVETPPKKSIKREIIDLNKLKSINIISFILH